MFETSFMSAFMPGPPSLMISSRGMASAMLIAVPWLLLKIAVKVDPVTALTSTTSITPTLAVSMNRIDPMTMLVIAAGVTAWGEALAVMAAAIVVSVAARRPRTDP